jgi:GR25 family glycosyltransferase involved in LPS biosynthesis
MFVKIYVVHYTKLSDRKHNLMHQLRIHNLPAQIITKHDKEMLTKEQLEKCDKNLSPGYVSNIMKHFECYKMIAENYEYSYGLIFEDDVLLNQYFKHNLENYINQLPENWDMCYLSSSCNLHYPEEKRVNGLNVYLHPWSRGADCYLVSKKCASKLMEYYNETCKITKPITDLMNDLCEKYKLKLYWVEPTISRPGSQTGQYVKSLP